MRILRVLSGRARILMLCLFAAISLCSCGIEELDNDPKMLAEDPVLNEQSDYIVVIGDIQKYTSQLYNMPYYKATMDWIWSQKQYMKRLNCVLLVGDVSDSNSNEQWKRFQEHSAATAAELPYIVCTGNHDYDWDSNGRINNRNSSRLNGYADFPLTRSRIVEYFEDGKLENIVVANTIQGERYDIISLEFGPRTEVVDWAGSYVSAHPERKFILMTHEFLTGKGARVSSGSYAERQIRNSTWSTPEQVWQRLVKDNDNIVCVLCGHNGFSARLYSVNSAGREVPQILFNLQYQENGGNGLVELWEFPECSDSVNVFVYSTITREKHTGPSTSFKFRYRY